MLSLVLYIDMDYFFAACEELKNPSIKDKPNAVSNYDKEDRRGVILTANYIARRYGVKSGISVSKALELCKDLIVVKADYDLYGSISSKIFDIIRSYGYTTEILSIDEAALNINVNSYEDAYSIAKDIKDRIFNETGLTASVGIAIGKIIAKIACDEAKPNGILIVKQEDSYSFIKDKSIEKIPGVGRRSLEELRKLGVERLSEINKIGYIKLKSILGSYADTLIALSKGIDYSKAEPSSEARSISREKVIEPTDRDEALEKVAEELIDELYDYISKSSIAYAGVGVKAVYQDFSQSVKSSKLNGLHEDKETIVETSKRLIRQLPKDKPIRKFGVRVYDIRSMKGQRKLF
ncbi:MAG: DNA polymerase IV [Candidatus Micrarchaeota archaeon]|nr:MAG: DNA polymerase IV [Candidatus Micrarchaeota archaeon]